MGNTELTQCLTVVCGHIPQPKAIQRELLIIMDTSALICFMEIDCIEKTSSCTYSNTGIAPVSHPHYFQVLCPSHPDKREGTGIKVILNL